jgi:hypothetical protein
LPARAPPVDHPRHQTDHRRVVVDDENSSGARRDAPDDRVERVAGERLGLSQSQLVDGALEITVRNGKAVMPRIMEIATQNNIYVLPTSVY